MDDELMPKPTKQNPRITFVRKAGLWVKTYFEHNDQAKTDKQIQEWSVDKPNG